MKTHRALFAAAALGLFAAPALAEQPQPPKNQPISPEGKPQPGTKALEERQVSDEVIPLDQVPEPARKAIQSWSKGGRIYKVEKVTTESGKIQYEAHIDQGGQKLEVLVTPDGKVLRAGEEVGD